MKASLDTNAIIHFYRAGLKDILFQFFDEGVVIYDQIRSIELENHGQELLEEIDKDISSSRIIRYTDDDLREMSIYSLFVKNVKDNRILYDTGDMGEVYAISLAQALGIDCLVTDDIKQGGPHMSLMQFEDYIVRPYDFAEILILRYMIGSDTAEEAIEYFNRISNSSDMNWSFETHLKEFLRRFILDPYNDDDVKWFEELKAKYSIKTKTKIDELFKKINTK